MTYYAVVRNDKHLEHHGIKGQKWGVRRFQNSDGSLTAAGRERYGSGEGSSNSDGSYKVQRSSSKAPNGKFEDSFTKNDINTKRGNGILYECSYNSYDMWYDIPRSPAQKALYDKRERELAKSDNLKSDYESKKQKYKDLDEDLTDAILKYQNAAYEMPEVQMLRTEWRNAMEEFRKASDKYYKAVQPVREKYEKKMLGQALTDLGYENTEDGRELLRRILAKSKENLLR